MASVEIISVLARPGTPSRMQWPREKRDQQLFDDVILADDDAGKLFLDFLESVLHTLDGLEVVLAK